MDMSMRVRHLGIAVTALIAGASLLRSSIPWAVSDALLDPTLHLTLSAGDEPATEPGPSVWVIAGEPAVSFRAAERVAFHRPGRFPDGVRTTALTVKVGRAGPTPILTNAVSVEDLLAALGVHLGKLDEVRPPLRDVLVSGMRVRVVQIRRLVETAQVITPFETLTQYSMDLDAGQSAVDVPGAPGVAVQRFRVTYRNGREVTRVLVSETALSQPTARVVLVGTNPTPLPESGVQRGQASWYDWDICAGPGLTAAHTSLPKGTKVTVTNLDNGTSVTVVINDRGPYGVPGRIIDLCDDAFVQIAPLGQGVANVVITW
jgi:hypothetical protein